MRRTLLATLVAVASAGWLAPAYLAAEIVRSGLQRLAADNGLSRGETYFADAERYLLIAAVWLGLVIAGWSFAGVRRLSGGDSSAP